MFAFMLPAELPTYLLGDVGARTVSDIFCFAVVCIRRRSGDVFQQGHTRESFHRTYTSEPLSRLSVEASQGHIRLKVIPSVFGPRFLGRYQEAR